MTMSHHDSGHDSDPERKVDAPRLAGWLLRRVLSRDAAEALLGDLVEEATATTDRHVSSWPRLWIVWQAFLHLIAVYSARRHDPPAHPRTRPRRLDQFVQDTRYGLRLCAARTDVRRRRGAHAGPRDWLEHRRLQRRQRRARAPAGLSACRAPGLGRARQRSRARRRGDVAGFRGVARSGHGLRSTGGIPDRLRGHRRRRRRGAGARGRGH